MQSIHRAHWGVKVAALCLLAIAVFLLDRGITFSSSLLHADIDEEGDSAVPGETNGFLGALSMQPSSDTLIAAGTNGMVPGSAVTIFDDNYRYLDDGDGILEEFTADSPLLHSTNNTFEATDEVVLAGSLSHFTAVQVALNEANGYIDSNSNGVPDIGDDFVGVVSGTASANPVVHLMPDKIFVNDGTTGTDISGKFFNDGTGEHRQPALIQDENEDGYINEADHVLAPGHSDISPLTETDKVCFDGSLNDDNEYDQGEIIWWDSAGDCGSFDTGVDIVLVGEALPTGASHVFGDEKEVGMYGADGSIGYACSRGGDCDSLAYTGTDGVNWTNHDDITLNTIFLTSSALAVDGMRNAGNAWDIGNNNWTMLRLSDVLDVADAVYMYEDLDSSGSFSGDEPILRLVQNGSGAVVSGGETVHLFDENDHYFRLNDSGRGFDPSNSVLVDSTDDVLDLGALDGSGTDEAIYIGQNVDPDAVGYLYRLTSANGQYIAYFDDDSSGSYELGDGVIDDLDNNGYYAADDLISIAVSSSYSALFAPSDDLDNLLSAVYVYEPAGSSCVGAGTDTLVGSITSVPLQGVPISITKDIFVSTDSDQDRTLCFYGDIQVDAPVASGVNIKILAGDAQFLATTNSENFLMNTAFHISQPIDAVVVAEPGEAGVDNAFTVTYTATRTYAAITGQATVALMFPTSFNVDHAELSCDVEGVNIDGDPMSGPFYGGHAVVLLNATTPVVNAGENYHCVATGVLAPSTPAVYTGGFFAIIDNNGLDGEEGQLALYDSLISYTLSKSSGGRDPIIDLPIIEPPTYAVHVATPNGGEVLKSDATYPISWTSNEEVQYVNLAYSTDGGATYQDIVRGIPNTGAYSWHVPSSSTTTGLVRVQSTDLSQKLNEDESDEVFTIVDVNRPYINWRSPRAGSILQAGQNQWLLWDSSRAITEVQLWFSEDGGVTYNQGTGRKTNSNAYQMNLPDRDIPNGYIKITGYAPGFDPITQIIGPISILRTVDTASLKITSPNTLQAFVAGQKTTITWNTTGEIPLVELQFAPDGKNWTTISPFIPNTGSYEWVVPDVESQYAFVRIGGNSKYGRYITDKSDEPFWIVRTVVPAVTIISPKGGTGLTPNQIVDVIWTSIGDIANVNLYMTFANGAKEALALGMNNTKLFKWTIPEVPMQTVGLMLEGLDQSGRITATNSAGPFTILGPISVPINEIPTIINPVPQDPCVLGSLRPGVADCQNTDNGGNNPGDEPGPTFMDPGQHEGGGSSDTVSLTVFDQTGLDIYRGAIKPRVSVANDTIEFDPTSTIKAIVGTNLLVQLVADKGNFVYATDDGRTEPFSKDASGVHYAYVPVGLETTHVKIQSQNLNPPFTLSLRVSPQLSGAVLGLETSDGSERVVLLKGGTEWDAGPSGQVNPTRLGKNGSFAWYAPNDTYIVEVRNGGGVLYSNEVHVKNNIVNPIIQLGPQPVSQIPSLIDFLIPNDVQGVVLSAVAEVRTNDAAQAVAAVAVPVGAAAAVTGAVVLSTSFNLLNYLQYLFTSPLFLFRRRRKQGYGTVYNAITKAPIPFAMIRFYDQENRIARTVVTDTLGRYSLTLPPGKYRPAVVKLGYKFPSEEVDSATDGELQNVFTGGLVTVTAANPVVNNHFPVDPDEVADRIVSLRRTAVLRALQFVIAVIGLVVSAYATFINPSKMAMGLLLVQLVIVTISVVLTKVHTGPRTGKVINTQGEPMAGVVVRLFEATYNKLVETQRTDAKGRYNFLVKDGQFYVVAETPKGKVTSQKIDYRGITELKAVAPVLKI